MLPGFNNSKDVIKTRMIKHALNFWNIKNPDDLDPIVKLILEALSNELYTLGNDILDTEIRMLEKIANLLAPELLTSPGTAHGLLHAIPVEPVEEITSTTHFYTQAKVSSKQDETADTAIDIFFTPVENIRLFDARVSCLVTGTNLFEYDQAFNKQLTAQTIRGKFIEKNVLWIGININDKIESIQKLFFCFDWKNADPGLSHLIYHLLPICKWYINDTEIETTPGIQYESANEKKNDNNNIFIDYDLLSLMEKDIKNFYESKIISLTGKQPGTISSLKEAWPPSFKNNFSEADLQKFNQKLLWLKVIFPAALQQESLDEVHVYTNTFPVMNRQLNNLKYKLKGGSNIIPLKTSGLEQFLAVKSFSDESYQYKSTPYRKMEEEKAGTYTLRSGGVERFDERNAKELLSYLFELLRSESSAFSAYGYDFIATILKEINQRIALMEQKSKGLTISSSEIPHYIIAKPIEGHEIMYADYWSTLAEVANHLRAGTRMQQYSGTRVKPDSLILLTTTTGGKNRLKPEERINAFRYGLITRNRIITKEDIRNFCFFELGDRISNVTIKRGFEMSPLPKETFMRTIDVEITPSGEELLEKQQWQLLCDQLRSKLEERSGVSNNYRVLLNK